MSARREYVVVDPSTRRDADYGDLTRVLTGAEARERMASLEKQFGKRRYAMYRLTKVYGATS